jgi:hypothetical protein
MRLDWIKLFGWILMLAFCIYFWWAIVKIIIAL